MSRRADLVACALASLALHGVLLAAAGSAWSNRAPPRAASGETASAELEVVALSAAAAARILDPTPAPPVRGLREGPRAAHATPALPQRDALGELPALPTGGAWQAPALPPAAPLSERIPRTDGGQELEHLASPELPRPLPLPVGTAAAAPAADAHGQGADPPDLRSTQGLVTHRVAIDYPLSARRRGIEGTATVALEVAPDGGVERAWILVSSGNRELDRAAVRGMGRWRFDFEAVQRSGLGRAFRQEVHFTLD